jgi:LacI family transcriptional regulator
MLGPLNYGNAGILSGLSRAARFHHQTLVTSHFDTDPASSKATWSEVLRVIDSFLSMRIDGLVITTPYVGVSKLIKHVRGAVPLLTAVESTDMETSLVYSNAYAAARLAVRHLLDLGHRSVLHIAGPTHRIQSRTRRQGYLDELAEAGLAPLPIVECAEWDAASGAICAGLVDPKDFTAVFAANDEIALGFSSVLRSRGLEAPRDYSIVGFDDIPEARYFAPPLTTMRLDFERIGELALSKILALARGEAPSVSDPLDVTLVIRGSTAPRLAP